MEAVASPHGEPGGSLSCKGGQPRREGQPDPRIQEPVFVVAVLVAAAAFCSARSDSTSSRASFALATRASTASSSVGQRFLGGGPGGDRGVQARPCAARRRPWPPGPRLGLRPGPWLVRARPAVAWSRAAWAGLMFSSADPDAVGGRGEQAGGGVSGGDGPLHRARAFTWPPGGGGDPAGSARTIE